ncbi:hypothetical protein GGG17_05130 [Arsenicicoccus sp. MKL-02]|uniref:Uncharacterized protein n=1 Tax=Arsenicicoccus cauae TaxID=2663847 RepID=A0A6I3ISW6_9MICO|nr:hypothetical protein [Arsenicicoccus cauae]MTB71361.1 hypothetical protein [Arsenicicoccus cauae]
MHLSQYDRVLGLTLTARLSAPPRSAILAVLVASTDHGIPAAHVRLWLRSRAVVTPVADLAASSTWRHLVKAARRFAKQNADESLSLATARRWVACVALRPPTGTTLQEVQARFSVALVGELCARRGWDTAALDQTTMALIAMDEAGHG